MTNEQIAIKLECHEQKLVDGERRIKNLELVTERIQELTLSVNKIAINLEAMVTEQKEHNSRLAKLEEEPAEKWNMTVKTVITYIIGGLIGIVISKIF